MSIQVFLSKCTSCTIFWKKKQSFSLIAIICMIAIIAAWMASSTIRNFKKMVQTSGLLGRGRLNASEMDMIYTRCKGPSRKINWRNFQTRGNSLVICRFIIHKENEPKYKLFILSLRKAAALLVENNMQLLWLVFRVGNVASLPSNKHELCSLVSRTVHLPVNCFEELVCFYILIWKIWTRLSWASY